MNDLMGSQFLITKRCTKHDNKFDEILADTMQHAMKTSFLVFFYMQISTQSKMPQTYTRKTNIIRWSKDSMASTMVAVRQEGMSIKKATSTWSIPRKTLGGGHAPQGGVCPPVYIFWEIDNYIDNSDSNAVLSTVILPQIVELNDVITILCLYIKGQELHDVIP